jgi:hypothetical protein
LEGIIFNITCSFGSSPSVGIVGDESETGVDLCRIRFKYTLNIASSWRSSPIN